MRLRRLTVIGGCLACLGGGAAAAPAASQLSATTLGAYAPTNAAVLYGTVSTGGASTNWAFEWGTTTMHGHYTRLQNIPAGASGPTNVDAVLRNLAPGTTYHYQLIAADGTQYSLGAFGGDRAFTTPKAGNVRLQSSSFSLRNGGIVVPLKCASSQACKGKLIITTVKHVHHKTTTLTCASKLFGGKAHSARKVSVKLARACTAGARKGGKLRGKLLVVLSSGQPKLSQHIVIKL